MSDLQFPHRRFNPLRRQWVLVSPHRTARPWQGEVNPTSGFSDVHYDPACYLCPGNTRAGGLVTPKYESVYVFDNDYAALLPDSPEPERRDVPELLRADRERGRCRVLCFHPDHSLTLARMQSPTSAASSMPGPRSTAAWAPSPTSATCRSSRTAAP